MYSVPCVIPKTPKRKEIFDKNVKPGEVTPMGTNGGAPKTIEAKGIRYEKAKPAASSEGGN